MKEKTLVNELISPVFAKTKKKKIQEQREKKEKQSST